MSCFDNFDKKKIAFVGNSFTFFGKCVNVNKFDSIDDGYFYLLARNFGDDLTVTNFTWGGASFLHKGDGFAQRALYEKMKELHPAYYNNPQGLPIDEFYCQDAVVLQQSGDCIAQTYEDAKLIMSLFAPETKFGFYITTYDAFHNFEPSFEAARKIRDAGGVYIPLGHIVDDIISGRTVIDGDFEYNKNSFVVCREHDKFHPNTLTGYLTALCTYCAFTQRGVIDASDDFVEAMSEEFYTFGESNHKGIINSKRDMDNLKKVVFDYCKKYNNV
ncbi:MAG: hypothetical protein E7678_02645 [Ruminococcaceae bacterium]|nr:hypothetical protein [Oscillospiraceae bacterium]